MEDQEEGRLHSHGLDHLQPGQWEMQEYEVAQAQAKPLGGPREDVRRMLLYCETFVMKNSCPEVRITGHLLLQHSGENINYAMFCNTLNILLNSQN